MASSKSMMTDGSLPPVAPRRTVYSQRTSSADLVHSIRSAFNKSTPSDKVVANSAVSSKPIPIPGSSHHQEPSTAFGTLSRSFTFESGGVRRKIPVTPVVSTGPKRHDTLHYRQGTLVFPAGVVGTLSVECTSSADPGTSKKGSPDPSILHFCQKTNLAALKNYISKHDGQIPSETLNLTDPSGRSGFMLAAMNGNILLIRELIHLAGIDLNISDNEGNTALHLAAQAGHADVVSLMAMSSSVLIDSRNHAGMTPLMKASLQGRIRCTRLLLLAGASPTLRDFRRSMCALEWARYTGRTKCAEIIDKYMEKMQLNPGLGGPNRLLPTNRYTSEPNLKGSSNQGGSTPKSKESWVKSTLRKAIQVVSGQTTSSKTSPSTPATFNVASHLTNSVLSTSISGSLPILPSNSRQASEMKGRPMDRPPANQPPSFVLPRIQVSFWNPTLGNIPPPPSAPAPKTLPQERNPAVNYRTYAQHTSAAGDKPQAPARSKNPKTRSLTSPILIDNESPMVVKIWKYRSCHD